MITNIASFIGGSVLNFFLGLFHLLLDPVLNLFSYNFTPIEQLRTVLTSMADGGVRFHNSGFYQVGVLFSFINYAIDLTFIPPVVLLLLVGYYLFKLAINFSLNIFKIFLLWYDILKF